MNKKFFFTLIFFLYLFVLIILAVIPVTSANDFVPKGFDKIIHFAEFFIFTFLLYKTADFYKPKNKLLKNKFLIVVIIAIFIALISELIQIPIPRREFSLLDLGADALGILAGVIVKWKFSKQ